MNAAACEVFIRFYSKMQMRTLDPNWIIQRLFEAFPRVARICFEPMSDAERAEAASFDSNQIVCVMHRRSDYILTDQGSPRAQSIETDIERHRI